MSGTLRWHYGPTEADPDPGMRWCEDCGGEVDVFDCVYVCGCGRSRRMNEEPPGGSYLLCS